MSTSSVPTDQPIAVTAANDPASLLIADLLRPRLMEAGFQVQSLYEIGTLPPGVQSDAFFILADVANGISETGWFELTEGEFREFLTATEATAGRSYVDGYASYLQAVRRVTDAECIMAVSALGSSRRVSAVAINTATPEVVLSTTRRQTGSVSRLSFARFPTRTASKSRGRTAASFPRGAPRNTGT